MSIHFSAHLSTLFQEIPARDRPRVAAAAGFSHVETWWPPLPDTTTWAKAVNDAGLVAACVNVDGGDLAAGDRGFANVPELRDEVVAATVDAARVVREAGGAVVNLLVGRRRNGVARDEDLAVARDTVRASAEAIADDGVTIVVEHLNRVDVSSPLLATPEDARAFVAQVDHPQVRVLFDAYHCAKAGCDIDTELTATAPLLGHVQYADFPGRGAPGSGTVALDRFVQQLFDLGYRGAVGLEYVPEGSTAKTFDALRDMDAAPFPSRP